MKLKYPNGLPFIFAAVAAIPFVCYYFALMFGELFFGRPSSTWAIGFVWIPFLVFRPALVGFIFGSLLWLFFRRRNKSGELPREVSFPLFALVILLSFAAIGTGFKKTVEHEKAAAPHVDIGQDLLEKDHFLANTELTEIRSITRDKAAPANRLMIIGQAGALSVDPTGKQGAFISFDKRVGETVPIYTQENEPPQFMNRGGGWQPVSLLDSNGKTLWLYPSEKLSVSGGAADSMAAGDLNKDGKLEFVVGMNASGGLHILDANGKEIWKRAAVNVFSVEVLDRGPSGAPVILHSDAGEGIVLRNAAGEKIKTIKNCGDGHFSFLGQNKEGSNPLLICEKGDLRLVDLNDKVIAKFNMPGDGHTPQGTLVYFNGPNNPPSHAFVRTVQATGRRSDLTIFDTNGTVIYHEIFGASYLAISSLTDKDKGVDALLIGENSRVWLYRMIIKKGT